jgi:hypothetical protein
VPCCSPSVERYAPWFRDESTGDMNSHDGEDVPDSNSGIHVQEAPPLIVHTPRKVSPATARFGLDGSIAIER